MKRIWSTVSPRAWQEKAFNGNAEFFAAMVTFAENKNPADAIGETPLHYAAMSGHLDVCRLLLENCGDQKNPVSNLGRTPLDHASRNGHSAIVELIKRYL